MSSDPPFGLPGCSSGYSASDATKYGPHSGFHPHRIREDRPCDRAGCTREGYGGAIAGAFAYCEKADEAGPARKAISTRIFHRFTFTKCVETARNSHEKSSIRSWRNVPHPARENYGIMGWNLYREHATITGRGAPGDVSPLARHPPGPMNSSTRRLYGGLCIFICASFAAVNLIGYGLKWAFFPVHLKDEVLWEFYNNVKQGDIAHAIELLSPGTDLLKDSQGKEIGLANGPHAWSFEGLALSEVDTDREVRGEFHLTNGADLIVRHGKICIAPGEKNYPWNTTGFMKLGPRERASTITGYLRTYTNDYWAWFHGANELNRLLGRAICTTPPRTKDEKLSVLNGLP